VEGQERSEEGLTAMIVSLKDVEAIKEAAYRAGREDAARRFGVELPAALAQSLRNLGEELGRESLSGPEMLLMVAELADMIERDGSIDLGRFTDRDGDSTP
jgi:hypothetical protein